MSLRTKPSVAAAKAAISTVSAYRIKSDPLLRRHPHLGPSVRRTLARRVRPGSGGHVRVAPSTGRLASDFTAADNLAVVVAVRRVAGTDRGTAGGGPGRRDGVLSLMVCA